MSNATLAISPLKERTKTKLLSLCAMDKYVSDHQRKPQKGSHQESEGKDLLEIKKYSGGQRKNIYKNDHQPYFLLAHEVITQCLEHLPFVVSELDRHREFVGLKDSFTKGGKGKSCNYFFV